MHKVFVSYHHSQDQLYADSFREFYGQDEVTFLDRSLLAPVQSDDAEYIMRVIRQHGLKQSTVTIVLVGKETRCRKYVDWEIYSSLRPVPGRSRNALLGVLLPGTDARDLPARFLDNFRIDRNHRQIGYAKLVTWEKIRPPISRLEDILRQWKDVDPRRNLDNAIRAAYQSRVKNGHLVNNDRLRMKRNKNCR